MAEEVTFADLLREKMLDKAQTEGVDFVENAPGWIEECIRAGGIPMFRTGFGKKPFMRDGEFFVLGVCWARARAVPSRWFRHVPPEDFRVLEQATGDWKAILQKYGTPQQKGLELTDEARRAFVEKRLPGIMREVSDQIAEEVNAALDSLLDAEFVSDGTISPRPPAEVMVRPDWPGFLDGIRRLQDRADRLEEAAIKEDFFDSWMEVAALERLAEEMEESLLGFAPMVLSQLKGVDCEALVDGLIEAYRKETRMLTKRSEEMSISGKKEESLKALNRAIQLNADLGELRKSRDRMVEVCKAHMT